MIKSSPLHMPELRQQNKLCQPVKLGTLWPLKTTFWRRPHCDLGLIFLQYSTDLSNSLFPLSYMTLRLAFYRLLPPFLGGAFKIFFFYIRFFVLPIRLSFLSFYVTLNTNSPLVFFCPNLPNIFCFLTFALLPFFVSFSLFFFHVFVSFLMPLLTFFVCFLLRFSLLQVFSFFISIFSFFFYSFSFQFSFI